MKGIRKIFVLTLMLTLMLALMVPTFVQAATWHTTPLSGKNTSSAVSRSFQASRGDIFILWSIDIPLGIGTPSGSFTLQEYLNGTWTTVETKNVNTSYPFSGGTLTWDNRDAGLNTFRIVFKSNNAVSSVSGDIHYFLDQ